MKKTAKKIKPIKKIEGKITLPGDKSISHRAIMVASLARGATRIENFLMAEDCIATMEAFRKMGVAIESVGNSILVNGVGLAGLRKPSSDLYLGNSGTSMRLLAGILAGQNFESTLSGDESLSKRPMKRITTPLKEMGGAITGKDDANFAPLTIGGGKLRAIDYVSPVASAQVKSCILFAGLYADGLTSITEPFKSRDHTERMLKLFNAGISVDNLKVSIKKGEALKKSDMCIPGDISSAAFFVVLALLLQDSKIVIEGVGINDTRTGFLDILKRMGACIERKNIRNTWEPVCDLVVSSSKLKATTIEKEEIPRAIDELPILMVASVFAKGKTFIKGASELRVKETDRINSMVYNLKKIGARVSQEGDNVIINGGGAIYESKELSSFADHRTAMAMSVASLCCWSESIIDDISCVNTSFPEFFNILKSISR